MIFKKYHARSAISILVMAFLLSACGDEKPEVLIASAKASLVKNDPKTAIIQAKNALQANPTLPEARYILGSALLFSGDPATAEIELEKARELKFSDDLVVPQLVKALLVQGKNKKITEDFSKITLGTPQANASLQLTVSSAYAALNMPELSQKALDAVLAIEPDNIDALLAQVRKVVAKNDLQGSLELIDKIISKEPKNPEALKLKGDIVLYGKNDRNGAIEQYKAAVEAKPDYVQGHTALINLLLQVNDLESADKQIAALKKLAPNNPETKYLEAQIAYQKKDYKLARDLILDVLKIVPDNARTLQLAGAIEYRLNSFIQAEIYFNKAVTAAPKYLMARRLLVMTYLRTGQSAKALATLSPVLAEEPVDPSLFSMAGEVYLQNGDVKKAGEYYAKAAKLDPLDARKRTSLALTHMMSGEVQSAFSELSDIASSDKGTVADMALISAYMGRSDFDKALKAIDGLEKKQPNNPLPSNLRGKIQLAKKDVAAAKKSFEAALALDPTYFPAVTSLAALDLADKNPDGAKQRFENFLQKDPKNNQALLGLAELKARAGGTKEEVSALIEKAIAANPSEASPRVLLVDYLLKSKDYKQAFSVAQAAINYLPDNSEVLDALGRSQQAIGDTNQAISTYNKIAGMQPLSPLPFMRLADVNMVAKNNGAAIDNLKKALEIKPDYLDAQRGLVILNVASSKYKEAIDVARAIQKQRPKEAIGYMLEGDVNTAQKQWADALAVYKLALKQTNALEPAVKVHVVLLASNDKAEADKFASSWLKDHPKDTGFMYYLADAALLKNDLPVAEKLYLSIIQQQPNGAVAYNNLAWIAGQLNKDTALSYAEKANTLAPNQPAFMDTQAMLLSAKSDYKKAIDIQTKAIALQPENGVFKMNLAKIYIKSGDKKSAKPLLEELQKLGDKFSAQAEVGTILKSI